MRNVFWTVVTGAFLIVSAFSLKAAEPSAQRALFLSGDHTLQGFIYKPAGKGPFPAIVFNQASTDSPGATITEPFANLAKLFTSRGYVFFVPGRHALPDSETDKKMNKAERLTRTHEKHAANIAAAVKWLTTQVDVDESRISIIGDAPGGGSSLYALEYDLPINAMIVFSPGIQVIRESEPQRSRLQNIIRSAKAPIFLIQVQNDSSHLPAEILGPILEEKSGMNRVKVFSSYGETASEAQRFAVEGSPVWQRDVFSFLQQTSATFAHGAGLGEK